MNKVKPYTSDAPVLRDYHTHTRYCDGLNTPSEMAEAALALGVRTYGFCVHTPLPYPTYWAATAENYEGYKAEIRALIPRYEGRMEILLGAEYDIDSGDMDLSDLDFVIGSAHQLRAPDGRVLEIDGRAEYAELLSTYGAARLATDYYDGVISAALHPAVDIVGHFDLITKYGENLNNLPFYRAIALRAVRKILAARPGMIFEINTGGMFRAGKSKPYPAAFILKEINRLGGRIVLCSDAHEPAAIAFKRAEAEALAREVGF